MRECVPEAEHRHHEADLLLRQAGRAGADREGDEPILVEKPDRSQEERGRERDGMEVVDHEPLCRRVEEVDEGECDPGAIAPEMLPCEQIDGNSAEGDGGRLRHEQELGTGPDPPQRNEEDDDRVEVRSEPGDLLAVDIGHLEESPVGGRPDDLGEIADVEPACLEGSLLQYREHRHARRKGADGEPEQPPRANHAAAIARSTTLFHRRPSVFSSARAT